MLTIGVFLYTLALMLTRPRGVHEAWWAVGGGALMLGLRLETWRQAWTTCCDGADVLLLLFALMVLSEMLDACGFFEWAAIVAARPAAGSGTALFRNLFILGAATTAFLSLDTTAIILTPVVAALVGRLKIAARPYLFASAMVCNTASLLLPISNLTNLLFESRLHFGFSPFVLRMGLPEVVACMANFLVLRHLFRSDISAVFSPDDLPPAMSVVPDRMFFGCALGVLVGVLAGYIVASYMGVPAYVVAFAGCVAIGGVGIARRRLSLPAVIRGVSWPLFPFVIGLFVVVRGVENIGLTRLFASALSHAGPSPAAQVVVTAFGAGIGSNIVNNIPMALLSLSVLTAAHSGSPAVYGALIGCDIGPNLTIVGSLATMLVLTSARRRGIDIGGMEFARAGAVATPIVLAAACLALIAAIRM